MLHGISVLFIDLAVVLLVYIDQYDDVASLQFRCDLLVALKELMQLVAPATPVGPELQEDQLLLLLGQDESIGNLLRPVGPLIVDLGLRRRRGLRRLRGQAGNSDEGGQRQHASESASRFHGVAPCREWTSRREPL